MPGIPVIIAANGMGIPVTQVEDNAPVMTLSTNGLGTPIVLTEAGSPFVIEGLALDVLSALSADDGANLIDDDDQTVETY